MSKLTDKEKARLEELSMRIRNAVVEHYLETGKPALVPDLAKRLRSSTSTVYQALALLHGGGPGVIAQQQMSGRAWTYVPALWVLRDIILDLRSGGEKKEP